MSKTALSLAISACVCATTTIASAQGGGETSGSFSASTSEGVSTRGSSTSDRPTDNYLELGLFVGAMFPSKHHNLEDSDTELGLKQHEAFKSVAPDLGLRLGYYPLGELGLELE